MIQVTLNQFGAGHGSDDTKPVADALALIQSKGGGVLQIPPGTYFLDRLIIPRLSCPLAIVGQGPGVTEIFCQEGIDITMAQLGIRQPHRLQLANFSMSTLRRNGTATGITIRADHNHATNEHFLSPLRISNVEVTSDDVYRWGNGIRLVGVWNAQLDHCFVSGGTSGVDAALGDWSALSGSGVTLEDMCVNITLNNCHLNFWAEGLKAHAGPLNTEGIFCSNCQMVGVKRGAWIRGNPAGGPGPRIHTFHWQGGMIENRAGQVRHGIAAFHLEHVWSASIIGCQMVTETMETLEPTYGVIPQECRDIKVTGCDINAYHHAFLCTGEARGHIVKNNTMPHCFNSVTFSRDAIDCEEDFPKPNSLTIKTNPAGDGYVVSRYQDSRWKVLRKAPTIDQAREIRDAIEEGRA